MIDWLISNHDGHSKQFLRAKDGKVYGIDKGQLFKFLGSDKLSIDYHPNGVCGEQEPFYNTLFRAAKQGKVTVDPSVTLRYIREVEQISDDDYLALLRPYVEGRFGSDEAEEEGVLRTGAGPEAQPAPGLRGVLCRCARQAGFRFEEAAEAPVKGRIGKAEEEIIEDARRLGWQGKALPIDEDDIEDQNALIFTETVKGQQRTVIKMKIRPEAEPKILPQLRKADRQVDVPKVGEPLAGRRLRRRHPRGGEDREPPRAGRQLQPGHLDKAAKHLEALEKLAKSDDPDVREMAETYIGWLERVQQAASDRKPIPETFRGISEEAARSEAARQGRSDFTVRKTKVLLTKRTISKGELAVESEAADNTTAVQRPPDARRRAV